MKTGNSLPAANDRHGVRFRDDSQLKDIEELVAKLQLVTKQLSYPARSASVHSRHGSGWPDDVRRVEHADGER
jgi:hypothetical protein